MLQHFNNTEADICLEFMPRGTLRNYITSTAPEHITPSQRHDWAIQFTSGLQHLHRNGIIWGDLGTRNCLLADDLSLRLCDFAGSSLPGFPPTIAPSGRCCKNWDESATMDSDHFGLGSAIYEIFTGSLPFQELTDEEVQNRFQAGLFPSTNGLTVGDVILKCWTEKYNNCGKILDN